MHLEKTQIPAQSLLNDVFAKADFAESYTYTFMPEKDFTIEEACYFYFNSAPLWTRFMFVIRNVLVRLIGYETLGVPTKADELKKFRPYIGNRLGLFKVIDKSKNEIVLGDDDDYLNFKNSILKETENKMMVITLSTIVKFNSRAGKIYFSVIKPFHRQIVKAMMRNMIRHFA